MIEPSDCIAPRISTKAPTTTRPYWRSMRVPCCNTNRAPADHPIADQIERARQRFDLSEKSAGISDILDLDLHGVDRTVREQSAPDLGVRSDRDRTTLQLDPRGCGDIHPAPADSPDADLTGGSRQGFDSALKFDDASAAAASGFDLDFPGVN